MDRYTVKRINTKNELFNLKKAWNALVFKDSESTLFQLWEWNYFYWEYVGQFSAELYVLTVHKTSDDEMVAILPFCLQKRRLFFLKRTFLSFLGGRFFDYQNVIIADSHRAGVQPVIASWIGEHTDLWDAAEFTHMTGRSFETGQWITLLRDIPLRVQCQNVEKSPYLVLDSQKKLLDNLEDRSFVKYLKRKVKKIEKDFQCSFITVKHSKELEKYFPVFVEMNKLRSTDKLQIGLFRSSATVEMFSDLAQQLLQAGLLQFHILLLDGVHAAALFNFQWKGRTYFYQSGFDTRFGRYSVGHVIHYYAIEYALKQNHEVYDFLNGDEPYKAQWTVQHQPMMRVDIIRSKLLYTLQGIVENGTKFFYGLAPLKKIYLKLFRK